MVPKEFVARLADIRSVNCFNPYSDVCGVYDVKSADRVRRSLLENMLKKAKSMEIDAIWIGRDLGYRGGRRTGLALTDEVHANAYANRWGLDAVRVTVGEPCKERTASVIWDMLGLIESNVFLWNVFPLHPHDAGNSFSNRSHNTKERQIGEEVLSQLIAMIKPKRLIAVGNDAVSSIARVAPSIPSTKVRHPSYGGQTDFISQVSELYGLKLTKLQQELF
jgi:hypothetical protein